MKKILLMLLIFASLQGFAQTFKITKVETSENNKYQELTKRLLNKSVKTTFNDNSVTINIVGENNPLTLRQQSKPENTYSFTEKRGSTEESYYVVFNTTFGVISSMELSVYKTTPSKTVNNKFTAKRF